ncbi:MAG TPA: hypothetical protein VH107_09680, partial [Lacipirellulaceae bacterium]|nr:hypothetical protein [Lacipirellulaceae bacterium]
MGFRQIDVGLRALLNGLLGSRRWLMFVWRVASRWSVEWRAIWWWATVWWSMPARTEWSVIWAIAGPRATSIARLSPVFGTIMPEPF